MSDKQFVEGIYFNQPHANAPGFVKLKLKLERAKLIEWLTKQEAEIYVQVKEAKSGKWYGEVDTWKPDAKAAPAPQPEPQPEPADEDLPF